MKLKLQGPELSSSSAQQQGNFQDSNHCNPIMDVKPSQFSKQSDVLSLIFPTELLKTKGKQTLIDTACSNGKILSEPNFLKRVLCEDRGNDFNNTKIVFLAIHAVFLESGFIGFDSMSGLRVDLFDIMKEQSSMTFTTSVSYTLPELLFDDNDTESIVLKFQTLGHYVKVYGSLAKSQLRLHKLNIHESKFLPAIITFWVNAEGCDIAYAEKVIVEFWKYVKDGIVLPLLIDLCEITGLDFPACLIQLPADLKFRILKLLPGQDIARVACVCKEMMYVSSNNELWKEKYMLQWKEKYTWEFGSGSETHTANWKTRFGSCWENTKRRKRKGRLMKTDNPFGFGQCITRHGRYSFANPRARGVQQRQYVRLFHAANAEGQ